MTEAHGRAAPDVPTTRVFVKDDDSEGVIRQSLNDIGVDDARFTKGTVETATATLTKEASPRLLVVDISGVDDPVARVNELADVCEPGIGVIVVGERNDIILYRDLRRAGVVEYLFKPLVRDLVTRTCNSILTEHLAQPSARTGKLVFVVGVRGGAGATTIATGTAWYLAEIRQRWIMLVDLDLQGGDAALHLDVTPTHALREAFEHPERVDKLFLERGVTRVTSRLDLLASLEPLTDSIGFSDDTLLPLLDKVLHRYRFVFVDLPAHIATRAIRTLHLPSICILVSTASLASARDVARWRSYIGKNTPERRTLHVLNQSSAHGGLQVPEFTRAAGQAPDIVIGYDRELAGAANLGVVATQKCPVLKRGIVRMLHDLMGEPVEEPSSLLARIFG